MKKNTATKWIVFAFDRTDNTPKTGDAANITANVRIDGAGANAVDDTNPTELEDGYYIFDITAAECNGDLIVICPASTTADIQVIGVPGAAWTDTLAADIAALPTVAAVADLPTVAEFEARTLVAADYTVVGDLPAAAPTADAVADAVWDEVLTGASHNVATSSGKRLRQLGDVTSSAVDDAAATTTAFNTDLAGYVNDFFNDQLIRFTSGALSGQVRPILDFVGATGNITVSEALTSAPANNDTFDIVPAHVHPINQIAGAVWDEAIAGHSGVGSTGEALSDAGAAGVPPTVGEIADAVWDEAAGGHIGAGSTGEALAAGSIATVDAKVDLILADTDELQTDLVDGGRLDLLIDAILLDTGTTLDGKLNAIDGYAQAILEDTGTTLPASLAVVDGNVDSILADTNELQTDWTADGRLDVILDIAAAAGAIDAEAVADAVWDEAMAGHVAAGSFGEGVANAASAGDPWSTPIPGAYAAGTAGKKVSDMAAEVTAILVDTGTTLDGKINVIDGIVDDILVDTGTTLDGKINVIDGIVDTIAVDTTTDIPALIAGLSIPGTPPTAAAIADAVWDEVVTSGHAVGNSAAVKLVAAAAGLATSVAGLGAVANVITVTISDVPLQGVDVWVTSDEAGVTVVAGTLTTDVNGQVTFYLDAGTYYVWQQKTGYNFTNPDELVVA